MTLYLHFVFAQVQLIKTNCKNLFCIRVIILMKYYATKLDENKVNI